MTQASVALLAVDPSPQLDILRRFLMARRRSLLAEVAQIDSRRQSLHDELAETEKILGIRSENGDVKKKY